ncbi:helix-turn-helix transcriptional regulator [Runella limosa]|uniref:helix-turn-helix transcriptional regulator n=1 Tax=Runella limosa TaxID=370978 RepID=UPI00040ADB0C|nr:helix-turn-helix transcriptional regulator [Runella limosa]
MSTIVFDLPMTPFPHGLEYFPLISTSLHQVAKGHFKLYFFDDNYKKGSLLLTKFQWPLASSNEGDNKLTIVRTNYFFPNETQIRYIPVSGQQYFILFYLSSDTDFSDNNNMVHKRGHWIISCLNTGTRIYSLLFPKGTQVNGLSIFIPTESLKSFINAPSDSYLKRLVHAEDSYLIYESASSRLKQLFEAINLNKMESLLEVIDFQEHIYAMLKTVFEQLSQNSSTAIKYNFKQDDLSALAKAEQLLLKNIKQPPTIKSLANEAAMSPTKFKSAFKKLYGQSVYKYYLNHRMELAHKWLLENKLNIAEIARELGYKNLTHFSRIFKEHFGELPSKYK